ncbi:MAG: hypothetical protein ACRDSL_09520 [Pseudonocardiaceae bacterium]
MQRVRVAGCFHANLAWGKGRYIDLVSEVMIDAVERVRIRAAKDAAGVGPSMIVGSVEVAIKKDVQTQPPARGVVMKYELVKDIVMLAQPNQSGVRHDLGSKLAK